MVTHVSMSEPSAASTTVNTHQRPFVTLFRAGGRHGRTPATEQYLGSASTGLLPVALAWMPVTPEEFLLRFTMDSLLQAITSKATASNSGV